MGNEPQVDLEVWRLPDEKGEGAGCVHRKIELCKLRKLLRTGAAESHCTKRFLKLLGPLDIAMANLPPPASLGFDLPEPFGEAQLEALVATAKAAQTRAGRGGGWVHGRC